jgi:ABC-type nitrate/sulfonate/bicarbonate transport system substrate-binding protein
LGLFRKYGLEVNLSYTAGAAQVIQAMMCPVPRCLKSL